MVEKLEMEETVEVQTDSQSEGEAAREEKSSPLFRDTSVHLASESNAMLTISSKKHKLLQSQYGN